LITVLAFAAIHASTPVEATHLASTVLALVGVLFLIIGLAWLLKRLPGNHSISPDKLKIMTHLNLGQRERLVVVEVGDQQLLLGITSQHISCLHTLAKPLPVVSASNSVVVPKFSQFMQKIGSKNTDSVD